MATPKESTKYIIDLSKKFIKAVLAKEKWFEKVQNEIDLILLTGSYVQGNLKPNSDVDLFIFVPLAAEIKASPPCCIEHEYCGKTFEVSIVSTEKLKNDANSKDKICWYVRSKPIFTKSKAIEKILYKASRMTKEEKKAHLWNNYVQFIVYLPDLKNAIKRKNPVGAKVILCDMIRFYADSLLVDNKPYLRPKQFGRICEFDEDRYTRLEKLLNIKSDRDLFNQLEKLRVDLTKTLLKNGFSEKNIEQWESYKLCWLKFQIY